MSFPPTIAQASTLVLFRFSYGHKRRRLRHRRGFFHFSYGHKRGRLRHRRGLLILGLRHLLDIALLRGEQGIPYNREEKVK